MCTNTPVLIPSHKVFTESAPCQVSWKFKSFGNKLKQYIILLIAFETTQGLFITCYNVCLIKAVDGI